MPENSDPSMSALRHRLARKGWRLWTPRGRWTAEYGPYALVNAYHNRIEAYALTRDDLVEYAQRRR
jgi:hypothetical protein